MKVVQNLVSTSTNAEISLSPTIIMPLLTDDPNKKIFRVRTLMDSGSGTNWITVSLLKYLSHTVKGSEMLEVVTFGGTIRNKFPLVEVLYPLPNGKSANIMCYAHDSFTRHVAVKGMVEYVCKETKTSLDLLENLSDPASMETDHGNISQGIGLILCSSSTNRLRIKNVVNDHDIGVLLEPTLFGVAISGAIPPKLRAPQQIILANNIAPQLVNHYQDPRLFLAKDDVTLPEDINFMWGQESLGIRPEEVHEDHRLAWESFMNSIVRDPVSGQYTVGLPWNEKKLLLRDNRAVAAGRTYGQRDVMVADEEYCKLMTQAKKDLQDKDYIEEVATNTPSNNITYYMPYRGIIKHESNTTKCRLVMDASSKPSASHVSLNQTLYQGPNLIVELAYVLLRFMLGVFGSVSDIEKAFLRILINESDRDALRFFWLENPYNPNEPLTTYRFKAVMFGSAASPFQLAAVLQTLIKDDCESIRIKKALHRGIYVDNIMYATDSEEEIVEFFEISRQVLAKGSFNLRQWASNSPKVMQKAKALDCADDNKIVKVLGLYWDVDRDRYLYNTSFEWDRQFTKRSALSYTNKVFDPLGWLTPMSVKRRSFIQKLWDKSLKWEDSFEFEQDFKTQWLKIVEETHIAVTSAKDRRVLFNSTSELHIFSDASKEAYGAVVYVRTPSSKTGEAGQVHLVSAKGKITPKKPPTTKVNENTIPKFELAGVVVAAHQLTYIKEAWSLPNSIVVNLWCDARVVLSWLSQYEIKQTYIHNRVAQVRELCHPTQLTTTIRHVPTSMNPADILTKDQKAKDFVKNGTWWNGPDWLSDEKQWPEKENYQLYPDSWKTTKVFTAISIKLSESSLLSFFNQRPFRSALRVMAYVLRAFSHKKRTTDPHIKKDEKNTPFSKTELDNTKLVCLRVVQQEMFTEELTILRRGDQVKDGQCGTKQLHLDKHGIIRSHGRLEKALEPTLNNSQILINGYHPFVQSYIRYKHKHLNCSSKAYTLHTVRKELVGPYLTVNVNKVVRECFACRVLRARPYYYPQMPALPPERLAAENPFAVCGIDYSGPHHVKQGRASVKVWIALFTCMVSRAVHLEIVPDLTADSFLLALRTMSWYKAPPKVIMTDNATNFTKSAKILKEISISNRVIEEFNLKGIEWVFTPAYAPHFGGIYERMIGTLKKELIKLIGLSQITYHELRNQLAEIEGLINTRPLIQVGNLEVITPKHILTGRNQKTDDILNVLDIQQIMTEAQTARNSLPQLYQCLAKRQAHFWHNFQHQYLESIKFSKDSTGKKNSGLTPKVNDLVIIHAKDPRLQWRKAVVTKIFPSSDGQVRKCQVQTATGQTIRAVRDLYPLEMQVEGYIDDKLKQEKFHLSKNDFKGFEDPKPPNRASLILEMLSATEDKANKRNSQSQV